MKKNYVKVLMSSLMACSMSLGCLGNLNIYATSNSMNNSNVEQKNIGLTCNLLTLALLCKSFRYAGENIQCC